MSDFDPWHGYIPGWLLLENKNDDDPINFMKSKVAMIVETYPEQALTFDNLGKYLCSIRLITPGYKDENGQTDFDRDMNALFHIYRRPPSIQEPGFQTWLNVYYTYMEREKRDFMHKIWPDLQRDIEQYNKIKLQTI